MLTRQEQRDREILSEYGASESLQRELEVNKREIIKFREDFAL